MSDYQRIVCATDFSALSKAAVAHANELASRLGATLYLIHVVEDAAVPAWIPRLRGMAPADLIEEWIRGAEADLQAIAGRCTAPVVTECRFGQPAPEILDYVRRHRADLLVAGSHGRRGPKPAVLGGVAERLAQQAPCPVLLIRGVPAAAAQVGEPHGSTADA
jgi:nucleotide-binding universal stress UspA family protein